MMGLFCADTATAGDLAPALSRQALVYPHKPAKVHLAPLIEVSMRIGGTFLYPQERAKCGVMTWGAAGAFAEVTCKRCLR